MAPALLQGWTLNYEVFFYLAFGAALLFRRGLAILCIAFALIVCAGLFVPEEMHLLHFWTRPIILEFVVGILLAMAFGRGWRLPLWVCLLCAAVGLVFFILPRQIDFGEFDRLVYRGFPALLVCVAFIFCQRGEQVGPVGRALRLGGDASYVLYLSHIFSLGVVSMASQRLGIGQTWPAWVAGISFAIAGAVVFHLIVEKPVLAWLTRWTARAPRHGPMDAGKEPQA